VHLTNPFRTGRAVVPALRAAGGGSIVVISSECAIRGSHRLPAYSVAKAGSAMLAEMFGAELARDGIRANAVCPTNTLPGMAGDDPATWRESRSGSYPSGDDIANAVAWLCSDEARFVSGATLRIDGANGAAMLTPPYA
jgi:NAD(P)-dependent dehydrogenase (short-subunit alcohol dehydrogenase family)